MKTARTILDLLIVEDNEGDAQLLREMLADNPAQPARLVHVTSMRDAEAYLAGHAVDVIVLDIGLPDVTGIEAVRRARKAAPLVPLVVLTGLDDELAAVQSLQVGAQDYLPKGEITMPGLFRALRYAIERKHIEGALAAQRELLQITLQSIGDAVVCTDLDGRVTFFNAAACQMTAGPETFGVGKPAREISRMIEACDPLCSPPGTQSLPADYMLAQGSALIPVEGCVAPITGSDGDQAGHVIVFRDVSAARAAARQMTHSAHHDYLTGLPNRLLLSDRINQAIALAPRHGKYVALLFLDLDGFKDVNDTLGHSAGDLLLKSIAERLAACVRASDTVSRQGGDEFIILLAEVSQMADAAVTARRILRAIGEVHELEGQNLSVTTSIGVSVYPHDGADASALIKAADAAMYEAKAAGRNGYQFFDAANKIGVMECERN